VTAAAAAKVLSRRIRLGAVRALWAAVQGNPIFMRRLNGWMTVAWILMIPVSFVLGWLHSVTFVSALSLWALVSGHWSTWQAARVEVAQQDQVEKEEQQPLEDRVVDALVKDTEIEPVHDVVTSGR
jgi:hypothetical protein